MQASQIIPCASETISSNVYGSIVLTVFVNVTKTAMHPNSTLKKKVYLLPAASQNYEMPFLDLKIVKRPVCIYTN